MGAAGPDLVALAAAVIGSAVLLAGLAVRARSVLPGLAAAAAVALALAGGDLLAASAGLLVIALGALVVGRRLAAVLDDEDGDR